jgi:uncharacterized protein (TIGR00369 family)
MTMTIHEIDAFLRRDFPQILEQGPRYSIMECGGKTARLRGSFHPSQLRPGGTLSGPTMMALADLAIYVAILAASGPVALAVTTNFSINFLRKPLPGDLIADARLLKLGKRLAVGEVTLFSEGVDEPVAHATMTYSLPPLLEK